MITVTILYTSVACGFYKTMRKIDKVSAADWRIPAIGCILWPFFLGAFLAIQTERFDL